MKTPLRKLAAFFVTVLVAAQAHALVLTMDLQAIIQTMALKAIGQDQVGALGKIFGVNMEQLETSQKINDILGSRDLSQITDFTGGDLAGVLKSIPGLEGVDVANLFPPNVGGAFLGKSFSEWKELIGNPSSVFASELKRMAVGDLLSGTGLDNNEADFLAYLTGNHGNSTESRAYVASTLSRLLTSRLMDSVQRQAEQTAAYAAQKERFSKESQKNLTLTDRAKLDNNQGVLSIELQLQQLQSQSMANSAQASQLDSQTRLLEEQIEFSEVDRASRGD